MHASEVGKIIPIQYLTLVFANMFWSCFIGPIRNKVLQESKSEIFYNFQFAPANSHQVSNCVEASKKLKERVVTELVDQPKPDSKPNLYVEWVKGKGETSKDADKKPNSKAGSKAFDSGAHGQAGGVESLTFVGWTGRQVS